MRQSTSSSWAEYLKGQSLEGYFDFLAMHGPMVSEMFASSPQSLIEVGCGGANLAICGAHFGLDCTGIDIEEAVIDEAMRHAKALRADVTLQVADGFATEFDDDQFDVAVSQGVLEHFSDGDIDRFLAESIRIAGRVIASMPNNNYPTRDFGNERLMPAAFWQERGESALRLGGQTGTVRAYDYRRRVSFRNPVNSILNTLLNRCYFTLLVIEKSH